MKPVFAVALLLAGCSTPNAVHQAMAEFVPTGATIGASGYATILSAPSPDYGKMVERQPAAPASPAHWYATDLGISLAEATKRMAEQQAIIPELNRLMATLQQREADNFISAEMVHMPDWHYRFYFKRDPAATLARYSSNPRFRAVQGGRHTPVELKRLVEPWAERLTSAGLATHFSVSPIKGKAEIYLGVTEEEYGRIAEREGWGAVPEIIDLAFARELPVPRVGPRAAPLVRTFASDTLTTGIQLEAGFSGRIVLVDGCLRLESPTGPLVYFHHETGLGIDEQGYLALVDRRTGAFKGRIGEMFGWAGPNRFRDDMPRLAELKARCGDDRVSHVGNPESQARFEVRYGN